MSPIKCQSKVKRNAQGITLTNALNKSKTDAVLSLGVSKHEVACISAWAISACRR